MSKNSDAEGSGLDKWPAWWDRGFRRRSDLEPGQRLVRSELEIERLEELVAKLEGDEVTTEMVPCDHPGWRDVAHGSARQSPMETVTRKQCTICGHKVTHIRRMVPRELL